MGLEAKCTCLWLGLPRSFVFNEGGVVEADRPELDTVHCIHHSTGERVGGKLGRHNLIAPAVVIFVSLTCRLAANGA